MKTAILWFRRDLRLHDNAALQWVCQNAKSVLPIYIDSPEEEQPWEPGGASRWWLHHSLSALADQLDSCGLKLHFFSGSSKKILSGLIKQTSAEVLVFNRLYEPHLNKRDLKLQGDLKNVEIISLGSGLFFQPGSVLNLQNQPYKVFTPFYRKIRPLLNEVNSSYSERSLKSKLKKLNLTRIGSSSSLNKLGLLDDHPWHRKLEKYWSPGEQGALKLKDRFLEHNIKSYQTKRDIPSEDVTSRLSPHLHFGEITPQQVYLSLWPVLSEWSDAQAMQSAELFIKQLLWREFAHHVLWHFPHTANKPMDSRFKSSFWKSNKKNFEIWTEGRTGVPIVDAGMRQLWETGWMHNRVRMIVSSFLTKNLGINWVLGAKWFWDTLVDADLANNSLGWQWVAGCGVDAAPYFRIFNPNTQTKRFDAELKYIDNWVPEFNELKYPRPIIDLAKSRDSSLRKYNQQIINRNS